MLLLQPRSLQRQLQNGTLVAWHSKPQVAAAAGPTSLRDLVDDYQSLSQTLTVQVEELKTTVEQVEKEREFYFQKLREIEVYIQARVEGGVDAEMERAFKDVQEIMYKVFHGDC